MLRDGEPIAAQAGVVGAEQLVEALDRLAAASADRAGRVMSTSQRWPLERVLFALAGTVILVSVALAIAVSEWFLVLTAFVGINQWLYVLVGACPASIVLRHACHLRSAVYDNGAAPRAVAVR